MSLWLELLVLALLLSLCALKVRLENYTQNKRATS